MKLLRELLELIRLIPDPFSRDDTCWLCGGPCDYADMEPTP